MGLLIVLGVLAVPVILVGMITRFRGRPPAYLSREDHERQIDSYLGRMESNLAHLVDDKRP